MTHHDDTFRAARPQAHTRGRAALLGGAAVLGAWLATGITAAAPLLQQNLFLLYLLAILAAGLGGGLVPGLLATVASATGAAVVLFEPVGSLAVVGGPDRVRALLLLAFGVLISGLAQALRSARRRLVERERALEISNESYRSLFHHSADALYILDPEGRVMEANRAAAELFCRSPEEMVGLTAADLSGSGDSEPENLLRLDRALDGDSQRFETRGRRPDGTTFPTEVVLSGTRYFGRRAVLAVARDLTVRRELEERLRQAHKLEAVGKLAGGVSHDFNNLLTTIRGHTALLAAGLGEDHEHRADVAAIERAADLATHVTRQLLEFSRGAEAGEARPVALNPAVESLEKMLRRVIGSRISFRLDLEDRVGAVVVDPGQIEQVVLNLVVNARDAMPDGGTITISTTTTSSRGTPCARLSVSDTGVGMDPKTVGRALEPFFTTKPRGQGTGLGLATVHAIVQQRGGRISIESEPGEGTTVHIDLPAHELQDPEALSGPRRRHAQVHGRVLLVEDEAPVRALVERVLRQAGCRVEACASAEEAWKHLSRDLEGFDLLLTDISLPGESGEELAARARSSQPSLPVLFASGSDGLHVRGSSLEEPASFLAKPFTPDQLLHAVATTLDGRSIPQSA